jgi:YD repeat-containing protein
VGSVTRTYDTDFRVATESVNGGNSVTFQYDPDSLLTGAGALTLTRHAQHGLLTGTTLGNVTDTYTYMTNSNMTNRGRCKVRRLVLRSPVPCPARLASMRRRPSTT